MFAAHPYAAPIITAQPSIFPIAPLGHSNTVVPTGFAGAGYGCGVTALDRTKAEAFTAAHKAHAASLDRAHEEATAYNTMAHARNNNNARYAQAAARDASEMNRYTNKMIANQHIAAVNEANVRANPSLVTYAPTIPVIQQ